jgi:hypothetical protein
MFRGVEEQAEHSGWQPRAADAPLVEDPVRIGRAQLLERAVHGDGDVTGEGRAVELWMRDAFSAERRLLLILERFASCIPEQPIERPGKVQQMKPGGRGSPFSPEQVRRDLGRHGRDVLDHLHERVSRRLQERGNTRHRTSKPDFRGHAGIIGA